MALFYFVLFCFPLFGGGMVVGEGMDSVGQGLAGQLKKSRKVPISQFYQKTLFHIKYCVSNLWWLNLPLSLPQPLSRPHGFIVLITRRTLNSRCSGPLLWPLLPCMTSHNVPNFLSLSFSICQMETVELCGDRMCPACDNAQ